MAHEPTSQSALSRLAAAQARVRATAKADLAKAAAEKPKPKLPTAPKPPNPKPTAAPPANAKARGKGQGGGKKELGGTPTREGEVGLASAEDVAAALRRASSRPEMASLVSDVQLVGVWNAILEGASRPGPQGAADRASLARALGLPIHTMVGGKPEKGGRGGIEVRGRLTSGLARSRSQAAVTAAPEDDEEPQLSAA